MAGLGYLAGLGTTGSLAIAAILLLIVYLAWHYTYFLRHGIPGPTPLPIFGNVLEWREGVQFALDRYLKKYGNCCGYYQFLTRSILVADPDMIKQIMVKHFDRFHNRITIPLENPKINKSLFLSSDAQWKKIRHTLTPAFSGRKMKQMSTLIRQAASRLVENFHETCAEDGKGTFECREFFGGCIMDTIGLCAFGLNVDSQKNKDDPFAYHAKRFFNDLSFTNPVLLISSIIPGSAKVLRWLGFSVFSEDSIEFFADIVEKAVDMRKSGKAGQKIDFLQLIIDAAEDDEEGDDDVDPVMTNGHATESSAVKTKTKREPLTKQELMSQALAFFIAGYETTTTALVFVAYILATNPDHQDRLIEEIDRLAPTADDITYDNLKQLTFLDCVINETLRVYPPAALVDRVCNETTTINGVLFRPGDAASFPIWSVHRNAKYWPDPEKFDPERFSKENQAKQQAFAFIPFGGGPRNCIGLRFAMMEIRITLVRVLQEFRFDVAPETQIPPSLGKAGFITPPNGIILRAVKRY